MRPDTRAEAQLSETFHVEETEEGRKDSLINPLGVQPNHGSPLYWISPYTPALTLTPSVSSSAPVGCNRQLQV